MDNKSGSGAWISSGIVAEACDRCLADITDRRKAWQQQAAERLLLLAKHGQDGDSENRIFISAEDLPAIANYLARG